MQVHSRRAHKIKNRSPNTIGKAIDISLLRRLLPLADTVGIEPLDDDVVELVIVEETEDPGDTDEPFTGGETEPGDDMGEINEPDVGGENGGLTDDPVDC